MVFIWEEGKSEVPWDVQERLPQLSEFVKLCRSNENPQILWSYSNGSFNLALVSGAARWPLWLYLVHLLTQGHVPKAKPIGETLCFHSGGKRAREALKASQPWLLSYAFLFIGQSKSHGQAWNWGRELSPVVTRQ